MFSGHPSPMFKDIPYIVQAGDTAKSAYGLQNLFAMAQKQIILQAAALAAKKNAKVRQSCLLVLDGIHRAF
jgi:hypothetical protein